MKKSILLLLIISSISSVKASDTLTIKEVFNFNVGDTFDYKQYQFNQCTGYFATSYLRKIVTSKSYSSGQDTIYYHYNLYNSAGWPFTGNQFFNATGFDTITNLDSFAIYLTEPLLLPGNSAGCTSAQYDTTTYWGYTSDSLHVGCFESRDDFRYTQRLGMTYFSLIGGGDPCGTNGNSYELIHFANDSMHFGYDAIDGITDLSKASEIYLSPNPAEKILHLIDNNTRINNYQFILTDLLGKELLSQPISQSETSIDISTLATGMYAWRLTSGNDTIKTGKVIKQ